MNKIAAVGFLFFALTLKTPTAFAQAPQTATDFTLNDCDGMERHLFAELDNGNVVVMEFEMGCTPCVGGRKALTKIQSRYDAAYPGKLQIYTMGFSAGMTCPTVQSWMSTNDFAGPTFAGNIDVINSYNAQEGMPTIVVLGGNDHKILYWKTGFSNKDTSGILAAIRQILAPASAGDHAPAKRISLKPNPASSSSMLTIICDKQRVVEVAVYNAIGTKVESVYSGSLDGGSHEIEVMTDKLANGTYYIHVSSDGATDTVPLTVTH